MAPRLPAPYRASGRRGPGRASHRPPAVIALTSAVAAALTACTGSAPGTSPGPAPAATSTRAAAVQSSPAPGSQTLSETGSSLMAPLFPLWGQAYHSRFSQVTLSSVSSSSGVGISSAAAGTTDIGASDAYLSPADMSKDPTLVNIPLAVAALMVIYNIPGVNPSTHLKLNGSVLARIFSGRITAWNDPAIASVNPGVKLPGSKIVLVHRADSSGSTFLFTSYLNAQDSTDWSSSLIGTAVAWPSQPGEIGASGSAAIVSSVASAPGSVSYVGVSYQSKVTAAGEGEAELDNLSGNYLLPTPSTIQAALASFTNTPANEVISLIDGLGAQAYPVINYEYAIVKTSQSSATKARDLRAFLDWAITSGTAELAQVNFEPLPSSVVSLSQAQIAEING